MRDLLHAPLQSFIHDDDLKVIYIYDNFEEGERNNNNPVFLHVLERAWAVIFGCADRKSACWPLSS